MPFAFLALVAFVIALVQLLKKGQYRALRVNAGIFLFYESFCVLGLISVEGWDLIPWFLAAFGMGAVHLIVFLVLALSLPNRKEDSAAQKQYEGPRKLRPVSPLPPQDRAAIPRRHLVVRPEAEPVATPSTSAERRALEYLEDRKGGELPFED